MKKLMVFLCAAALAIGVVGQDKADALVLVDFEALSPGYWDGSDYAYLGVTFSAQPDPDPATLWVRNDIFPLIYGNVLSTTPSDLSIITSAFFALPADYVRIENPLHGVHSSEIDVITASAYDSANNLLGTVTQNPGDQFLELTYGGMASVSFNDVAGYWGNGYVIDNFAFNPVPEPGTLVLLGIGLLGAAGIARHTKK